jgi:hypothetical protein
MQTHAKQDPAVRAGSEGADETPLAAKNLPQLTKAKDALNLLSPLVGGPAAAKDLIIEQVYQGGVRAFASRQWEGRGFDVAQIWKDGPPPEAVKKASIPRKLFRPTKTLVEDTKDWSWTNARFFITISRRPARRHMMQAVRFASDDIRTLAKAYGGKVGKGGRPPKMDAWTQVWIELVRIAAAGELTKERQGNREAFRRTVFEALEWDKIEKPPLAEVTIGTATGRVWDEVIDPKVRR